MDRRITDEGLGHSHRPEPLFRNPLFGEASGEIAVGRRIFLRNYPAGGRPMTLRPTITAATAGTELGWASRLPGIIGGEHRFELSARNGGTLVVQVRPSVAPWCRFRRALARAETSFRALNGALKVRAESL